jgi:S-adenosylmethionine:tRNA ribosyltransferase-isomerase
MAQESLKLEDFDFELPKELIAQDPLPLRDTSKLLVIKGQKLQSGTFTDIIDFLNPGDVLVLNDSKVVKSRIFVIKGHSNIELFFHKQIAESLWQAFAKPAKKISKNDVFDFGNTKLLVEQKLDSGEIIIRFDLKDDLDVLGFLEKFGQMPLPPYIKRSANEHDEQRYQTIFAQNPGSVAAPTAGLHFTTKLLEQIKAKGVKVAYVTLHVGAGTFLPIKVENIESHIMHYENYTIPHETANIINQAKQNNNRVIAVGTTTLRTLESAAQGNQVPAVSSSTNLFIKPRFKFQIADMLITNFHLPKSTLLLLVSAFGGYQNIRSAYEFAIQNNFRFFSYGDANLIYRNYST